MRSDGRASPFTAGLALLERWLAGSAAKPCREGFDAGELEQLGDGELRPEGIAKKALEPKEQERIAPDVEEVVAQSDLREPEQVAPVSRDLPLRFAPWVVEDGALVTSQRVERAAVELSRGSEREPVQ